MESKTVWVLMAHDYDDSYPIAVYSNFSEAIVAWEKDYNSNGDMQKPYSHSDWGYDLIEVILI